MVALDDLDHEHFTSIALALAREAGERGDEPFGAVLVDRRGEAGELVMEEHNAVVTADDIARHPELTLARRAAREFDADARESLVLYTSTEPCAMCSGGVYIAGLGAVVYSVGAATAAALTGGDFVVPAADVFDRGERSVEVVGPVLEAAGKEVHRNYW